MLSIFGLFVHSNYENLMSSIPKIYTRSQVHLHFFTFITVVLTLYINEDISSVKVFVVLICKQSFVVIKFIINDYN
jgi:hypothetical protein